MNHPHDVEVVVKRHHEWGARRSSTTEIWREAAEIDRDQVRSKAVKDYLWSRQNSGGES